MKDLETWDPCPGPLFLGHRRESSLSERKVPSSILSTKLFVDNRASRPHIVRKHS
jgi:hypothetical protein